MMCIIKKKHVRFTAKEKKKIKINIFKKFVNHAHFYAKHASLF